MKKQKTNYRLKFFYHNPNFSVPAKKEIPFEIQLASQLVLDNLCFNWNKSQLEEEINRSLENNEKETFKRLSNAYASYIWEG